MGIFRKKGSTHFERDEAGNVIGVSFSGDQPKGRTPVSDALLDQYYEKHPEKTKSARVKKAAIGLGKRLDDWSRNYNKSQKKRGPILTWNPPSSSKGRQPLAMELFNFDTPGGTSRKKTSKKGNKKYVIQGGKAYPIAKQGSKKTKGKGSGKKRGYNPDDPFDFPRW